MDPDALTSKIRSLLRSAGIKKKGLQPVHGLRHIDGEHAFANGVDLVTVPKRLGHSRASTTADIYLHAMDDDAAITAAQKIERAMTGDNWPEQKGAIVPQMCRSGSRKSRKICGKRFRSVPIHFEPNRTDICCFQWSMCFKNGAPGRN